MTTTRTLAPTEERSQRTAALVAGAAIILLGAVAAFGRLVAVDALVTPGDPTRTLTAIVADRELFTVGVLCLYAAVALDVVIAWALYLVFRPVDGGLALLAAWYRTVYAAVFLVAISHLAGVLGLLGATGAATGWGPDRLADRVYLHIEQFTVLSDAGLLLFALHLILLGALAHRAFRIPRAAGVLLGLLLVVAGLGYAADTIGPLAFGGTIPGLTNVTWIGELLLAVWLLLRHRRLPQVASSSADPAPRRHAAAPQ